MERNVFDRMNYFWNGLERMFMARNILGTEWSGTERLINAYLQYLSTDKTSLRLIGRIGGMGGVTWIRSFPLGLTWIHVDLGGLSGLISL